MGIEGWRRLRRVRNLPTGIAELRRIRASRTPAPHGRSSGLGLREPHPRAGHSPVQPGRTYLVTGCAGFIGSHLVEALNARGCSVIGVDGFIDNYPRAAKERNLQQCAKQRNVEFIELDLAEAPVAPLLHRADGIFHLAARPGVRTSWGRSFASYIRDNTLMTERVFEAAVERGIRVVYASSSSVYGDADAYPVREDSKLAPVSPYGVTKLAGEALAGAFARSRGLDAVGLRYFTVYGPRQRPDMAFARVFRCLEENRPFRLLGHGLQTREFTYVDDVVSATLAAMDRAPSGRIYNVGGGTEISLLDSLSVCERIVGRRLEVQSLPAVAGDPRRTSADVGRARTELGWRPTTPLEVGLLAQARAAAVVEEHPRECAAVS